MTVKDRRLSTGVSSPGTSPSSFSSARWRVRFLRRRMMKTQSASATRVRNRNPPTKDTPIISSRRSPDDVALVLGSEMDETDGCRVDELRAPSAGLEVEIASTVDRASEIGRLLEVDVGVEVRVAEGACG